MAEKTVKLPWGKETISVAIPSNWNIKGILEPTSLPPVTDPREETKRALASPVGSATLAQLASLGGKVVVVIDDISRPTPVPVIFPEVYRELIQAGIRPENVTVVPALGVHRGMEEKELLQRLGIDILE